MECELELTHINLKKESLEIPDYWSESGGVMGWYDVNTVSDIS